MGESGTYRDRYDRQLEAAWEFEDFVAGLFLRQGMVLMPYRSKRYQCCNGENHFGVEIKFDDLLATTRNLWIEIAEKSNPNNTQYVESGVFRNDNAWLFAIGNYSVVYVFGKRSLQVLSRRYEIRENKTKTSRGFLFPSSDAERWALKVFRS